MVDSVIESWRGASERERLLKVVQPGLIGLIDGTVSTLAPIFAAAYLAGSRAALLVGVAADVGAAITVAYPVVGCELLAIAWIRRRFLQVSLTHSLVQVTLAGAMVATVGVAVGQA